MPFDTNEAAAGYILGPNFTRNNPGFEHEQKLLRDRKLVVSHQSLPPSMRGGDIQGVVQLRSVDAAGQEADQDASRAVYWYRAMTRAEYLHLKKHDEIQQEASYGGIATNAGYVRGYMTNEGNHSYLVEFNCYGKIFYNHLSAWATDNGRVREDPKAEGGGGTFGLGTTGHYKGDAGKQFNRFMQDEGVSWRLLHLYLTVR